MSEAVQPLLHKTVHQFSHLRDAMARLIESARMSDPDLARTVGALMQFAAERAQSVVLLIQDGRLWDAEILMRTFTEAILRALYTCTANTADRRKRIREYWSDLAEVNELKQSSRARELLESLPPDPILDATIAPLVLPLEREQELRARWPSAERRRLESRWGFSSILRTAGQELSQFAPIQGLQPFTHFYGIGSHLIHADETGIGLFADRVGRSEEQRHLLETAHACRMLSDVVAMPLIVGFALAKACQLDSTQIHKVSDQLAELEGELGAHIQAFAETI